MALEAVPPVLATFLLVFFTTYLCRLLRSTLRRLLKDDLNIYQYAAEVISTFQLVAGMLEGDTVLEEYGYFWYGVYLWIFFISLDLTFDGNSTANACAVWHSVLIRNSTRLTGILKILLQVLGGQLAFPYMKLLWMFSPLTKHRDRRSALLVLHCQSALKVSILEGCFAESLATFMYFFMMVTFQPKGRVWNALWDATVQVAIILVGLEWTGMMFNPALASALTFNCVNHPLLDHLLVYWVAPMATIPLVQSTFGKVQKFKQRRQAARMKVE